MNILLVDDEAASRTAIRLLADWQSIGASHIFEAEDGLEALALMEQEHPDIVFLDMNMPLFDGPSFLKKLRSEHMEAAVIVVSGYDRFDYAVQAIEAGAVSYLLKPIDPEQLNEALQKAAALIRSAKVRQKMDKVVKREDIRALLARIFFQKELVRTKQESSALEDLLGRGRTYRICAMRFGNLKQAFAEYQENSFLLGAAIRDCVEKQCQRLGVGLLSVSESAPQQAMLLLLLENEAIDRNALGSVLEEVRLGLRKQCRVSMLMGISEAHQGSGAVETAAEQARSLLMQMNLFEAMQRNMAFAPTENTPVRFSALDMIPLYRRAISTKNKAAFLNILHIAFQPLRRKGVLTLQQADRSIAQQISMMTDLLRAEGISDEVLFPKADEVTRALAFDYTTFDSFFAEMRRLLEITAKALSDKLHWERAMDIRRVKEYIDENCHRDLRVQNLAEVFFVSREHLTKLFSRQFGVGVQQYIESVRMEKVRQLLDQPGMRVQDVAQLMDFLDANYLSKKFRKFYGLSPSQYQEKVGKEAQHEKPEENP